MRFAVLLLVLLPATGCRSPAPPIDVDRLREEGRLVDAAPVLPLTWGLAGAVGDRPFRWQGEGCPALDGEGRRTSFVLDTGTSVSRLFSADPLAAGVRVVEKSEVAGRGDRPGKLAVVPRLSPGGLTGREAVVALIVAVHDLDRPVNLIGRDLLRESTLSHREGEWSLSNGPEPRPPAGAELVPLRGPGLPVVRLRDAAGRELFALLDTGAPLSRVVEPTPPGVFSLRAGSGREVLRVRADHTIDGRGLKCGGRSISVVLGLDALETIDFDIRPGAGA